MRVSINGVFVQRIGLLPSKQSIGVRFPYTLLSNLNINYHEVLICQAWRILGIRNYVRVCIQAVWIRLALIRNYHRLATWLSPSLPTPATRSLMHSPSSSRNNTRQNNNQHPHSITRMRMLHFCNDIVFIKILLNRFPIHKWLVGVRLCIEAHEHVCINAWVHLVIRNYVRVRVCVCILCIPILVIRN